MTKNILSNICWKEKKSSTTCRLLGSCILLFQTCHTGLPVSGPSWLPPSKPAATLSYQLSGAGEHHVMLIRRNRQASLSVILSLIKTLASFQCEWQAHYLFRHVCKSIKSVQPWLGHYYIQVLLKAIITGLLTLTYSLIFVHIS